MSRVLVTGGAGFIGLQLTRQLLVRGMEVDLVDNFSRGVRDAALEEVTSGPGVRLVDLDLMDDAAWGQLDDAYSHVFHLAAILGVAQVLKSSHAVLDRNIRMTSNALAFAARQRALQRFVFASTSEVYAGTLVHHGLVFPTPESTALTLPEIAQPRTSYMLSKIVGEALCQQAGLPFTVVRPHNIYGPRMGLSHVVPELMQRAYAASDGDTLTVYSPDHQRTFCYVEDAATLVAEAALAPEGEGATLNVGVDTPEVTIRELAAQVLEVVGRDLRIVEGETTAGSPTRRCPDISAIAAVTGRRPAKPLREGLEATFAWYRDRAFTGTGVSAR